MERCIYWGRLFTWHDIGAIKSKHRFKCRWSRRSQMQWRFKNKLLLLYHTVDFSLLLPLLLTSSSISSSITICGWFARHVSFCCCFVFFDTSVVCRNRFRSEFSSTAPFSLPAHRSGSAFWSCVIPSLGSTYPASRVVLLWICPIPALKDSNMTIRTLNAERTALLDSSARIPALSLTTDISRIALCLQKACCLLNPMSRWGLDLQALKSHL